MSNRNPFTLLAVCVISLGLSACFDSDDDAAPIAVDPPGPAATYSISGTASGLTGAMSLQNSNGTTLNVSADGTFTFATPMPSGATYGVTVSVPPNLQTCTVANGSGAVLASNITNIAITCITNSFTLGGTVSGLDTGRSVVLRALSDGVSGSLALDANGAFAFPQSFVNGAEYQVLVFVQPLGQTCTVANDVGDITGASATNLAVTCIDSSASARNWGAAASLVVDDDQQDTDTFRTPQVAFDAAGNALAIWEQDRDLALGSEIYFSRYTAGGSWSAPSMIPNLSAPMPGQPSSTIRRKPQLAVAANGAAVAVWVENVYSVAASFYDPGTGWSAPEHVRDNIVTGNGGTIEPKVAIDASGNVLVVWENNMVNYPGPWIYYNRYSPGTGWVSAVNLSRIVNDLQFTAREPEIAMLPNGNAIAIWKQSGGGGFDQSQLWSSRYDMTADTWSTPQAVDTHDTASPIYGRVITRGTSVLLDANGTATALWSQYDGTHLHILANRLTGNTWGTPVIVETSNDTPQSNAFDVRASIDGSGNIMAMWRQNDSEEGHYVANRYVPGTGWGTQVNIGEWVPVGHVADSTEFELVSNAAGHTVAVWTLVIGIGDENVPLPVYLSANEYNPVNNSWGAEEAIDRVALYPGEVEGDAMSPSVAVDADGNAIAVWVQQNSANEDGVRVNRFE